MTHSCFKACSLLATALLVTLSHSSTLQPPVLPLIVRNPYLSTWLPDARNDPWSNWPIFYTGRQVGLGVLVSVPESGTVYPLLGRPQDSLELTGAAYNVSFPSYLGSNYDASTTNLTYQLPSPGNGRPAIVTLSFLSPVTPTSTLRQSIPAAYLAAHVTADFDLDLYIDLNGEWVSGDRANHIEWELDRIDIGNGTEYLKTWTWRRRTEQLLTEHDDRAEWGSLRFTGPADVQHEAGSSVLVREAFAKSGRLGDRIDRDYRSIMDEEPVFAFSKPFRLADHSSAEALPVSESALFTIAHLRDPVTQFASARGLTLMRPLWKSWFPTDELVTKYHYLDYNTANALALNYSDQLATDAFKSGSDGYVDIVALSARQALAATDFAGTPENPMLFLKEISSDGNAQTIDVIFPAFPFFLYTQPRWLAYLLEPLLEHTLSGQYPNKYAMHDLGSSYPNLTGHADGRDEYMPVEECGNMLIMGLALVNSLKYDNASESQSLWSLSDPAQLQDPGDLIEDDSLTPFGLSTLQEFDGTSDLDARWGGGALGDKQARTWLRRSYRIWKQWTGYLVEYSLEPENQLCTDDFAGWLALQTNLALKGIVGIRAMSELAGVVGEKKDAKHYEYISNVYIEKWQEYGMSRDGTHAKLAYDWYGSWTTLYSLYADALLCFHPSDEGGSKTTLPVNDGRDELKQQPMVGRKKGKGEKTGNFIPQGIYQKQSTWYSDVLQKYGLPLDSRHLYAKSDWELEAAAVSSAATRKDILDRVARWVNETVTDKPLTDLYSTEGDGGYPDPFFYARPVVGGHFASLAIERACGGRALDGVKGLR